MKDIVILGTGGNCIDILDTINDINEKAGEKIYNCVGFLDDNIEMANKTIYSVKVLGSLNIADCLPEKYYFVNGIGSPKNFFKKEEIIKKTNLRINRFETIIHPSASVSRMAKIGKGNVILQNVSISSNAVLGNHIIILPNSIISHDTAIGDFTSLAGGVCISGNVKIGKCCYLGSNCSIINGLNIGSYSLIGMGSVILKNVKKNTIFVGNPAKFLRYVK